MFLFVRAWMCLICISILCNCGLYFAEQSLTVPHPVPFLVELRGYSFVALGRRPVMLGILPALLCLALEVGWLQMQTLQTCWAHCVFAQPQKELYDWFDDLCVLYLSCSFCPLCKNAGFALQLEHFCPVASISRPFACSYWVKVQKTRSDERAIASHICEIIRLWMAMG